MIWPGRADFEAGLSFLEPNSTLRKANCISRQAAVERVEMDREWQEGFFVRYNTGEKAEVSWAFIRELPPERAPKKRPRPA